MGRNLICAIAELFYLLFIFFRVRVGRADRHEADQLAFRVRGDEQSRLLELQGPLYGMREVPHAALAVHHRLLPPQG